MGCARGSDAFCQCGEDRRPRRLFCIADITVMRQNYWKLQCGAVVERTWKTRLVCHRCERGCNLYEKSCDLGVQNWERIVDVMPTPLSSILNNRACHLP